MTADLERLRRAEQAAEAARVRAHRADAERHAGVCWSGFSPDPRPARTAEALDRDTATRLAALQAWRSSRAGRLLAALDRAERAVEAIRACVARGLAANDARCGLAIGDLRHAAAAARSAMDAPAPGALSDRSCATSFASSCPSTASPTNSAS